MDVINLYDTFSKLMIILTGGTMLNFGYWNLNTSDPLQAQDKLSSITGEFASLKHTHILVDVGSGYSAPAFQWISQNNSLKIICINLNFQQIQMAISFSKSNLNKKVTNNSNSIGIDKISYINSTSTRIPIKNNSVDRIVAFESAQHFKPLVEFIKEARRILKQSGTLVIAMPVVVDRSNPLSLFFKLGILSFTWASEHYKLQDINSMLKTHKLELVETKLIGHKVYKPLARYYIKNRNVLKQKVIKEYSRFLELILYESILKMEQASEKGIIDYVLLKAQKT